MGGNVGKSPAGLRLGLLALVAALFVLIPVAQASAEDFTLTVNVEGEGEVYCDTYFEGEPILEFEECGAKKLDLPEETEVVLTAIEAGDEFKEFIGCEVVGPEECEVTMDEDREVTAVFEPEGEPENPLTVNVVGPGEVQCELEEGAEECASTYPQEAEVTLVPIPAPGSTFVGWSGDCTEEPCELEMDEAHEVTATFESEESGGGGGGGGSTTPPLAPAVALPGKLQVGRGALYRGGRATLRLSCKGGPCKGRLKLIAKLKAGKGKAKKVTIGKASLSLASGRSTALMVKLSRPARKQLDRGRAVTAWASGQRVKASKVKIRPASL